MQTIDSNSARTLLHQATAGLQYVSESNSQFTTFDLAGVTDFGPTEAREIAKQGPSSAIDGCAIEDFFQVVAKEQDWMCEKEKADVQRYRDLGAIFTDRLSDPKYFRVGRVHVHLVLAGKTTDGHWVGVQTVAVDT